jgi:hypothetical protein
MLFSHNENMELLQVQKDLIENRKFPELQTRLWSWRRQFILILIRIAWILTGDPRDQRSEQAGDDSASGDGACWRPGNDDCWRTGESVCLRTGDAACGRPWEVACWRKDEDSCSRTGEDYSLRSAGRSFSTSSAQLTQNFTKWLGQSVWLQL